MLRLSLTSAKAFQCLFKIAGERQKVGLPDGIAPTASPKEVDVEASRRNGASEAESRGRSIADIRRLFI